MIPAEQAGVAFIADPRTGAVDRVVIEAVSDKVRSWCRAGPNPTSTSSPRTA